MPRPRQRTQVGRRKTGRKYMKRTTKKGAYNKARKKQMMIRRAPFVETKSRTHEDVYLAVNDSQVVIDPTDFNTIPNVDSSGTAQTVVNLPVLSMLSHSQGLGEDQMIGLSVFGKYLKAKLQFKLPSGVNAIQHAADVYLVHGFVKAPFGRTSFTTPTAPGSTRADVNGWISRHIKDFLDQREDRLRFIPKQNTNISILGYRRIKPNRNASLGVPAQAFGTSIVSSGFKTVGANPIINMSCYWPVKRKVYYTPGSDSSGNSQHLYPNACYHLPFMAVYNPTAGEFTSGSDFSIKVAYNDCFWYSDS